MKKTIKLAFMAVALMSGANADASGIPVVDVAGLAQAVQSFQQLQQQYKQLQAQYSQLQKLENISSGSRGLGAIHNNPAAGLQLPTDPLAAVASIRSSNDYSNERAKLPTSAQPKLNALYDQQATLGAMLDMVTRQAGARVSQQQNLMQQIDLANDPAAKNDLANRLSAERNAMEANKQLAASLQAQQAKSIEDASRAAGAEFRCREFNHTGC